MKSLLIDREGDKRQKSGEHIRTRSKSVWKIYYAVKQYIHFLFCWISILFYLLATVLANFVTLGAQAGKRSNESRYKAKVFVLYVLLSCKRAADILRRVFVLRSRPED